MKAFVSAFYPNAMDGADVRQFTDLLAEFGVLNRWRPVVLLDSDAIQPNLLKSRLPIGYWCIQKE